jgi:hypothetical protein
MRLKIFWSIRHYHGWQFIPLVLFVLVLSETVLVVEEKYLGYSFPDKGIDLNRFRRFRVRVPRR